MKCFMLSETTCIPEMTTPSYFLLPDQVVIHNGSGNEHWGGHMSSSMDCGYVPYLSSHVSNASQKEDALDRKASMSAKGEICLHAITDNILVHVQYYRGLLQCFL